METRIVHVINLGFGREAMGDAEKGHTIIVRVWRVIICNLERYFFWRGKGLLSDDWDGERMNSFDRRA